MKITLIGLGVKKDDLTLRAAAALSGAGEIIARTSETESFKALSAFNVRAFQNLSQFRHA